MPTTREFPPIELVFNPNWWYHTAGISFDDSFYFDAETRVLSDITMRRVLHGRYGGLGPGVPDPQPRPTIGCLHIAGGFVIPALPDAFVNLRLSPVRMLQYTPQEMAEDMEKLLRATRPLEQAGICCINMDHGTSDDNIFAMEDFEVVRRYRRYGTRGKKVE